MPQRYSRHYYDLYRMAQTPVKDVAFSHIDLLKTVVDFKMKFYPRAWAKYPEAIPGTLKLIPPEYRFPALINDYEAMKDMLYGDIPSFNTIMETNYPAFTVPRGFKCRNNREINDIHTNLITSIYCSKPSSITSPVESKRTELRALR